MRRLVPPAIISVAALIIAALVWVPPRVACGGPGSGLVREGGECVGVTYGSPALLPSGAEEWHEDFRAVQDAIREENDRVVAAGGRHVTIGLISTLTPDEDGPLSPERVLRSLQGAHAARMRANHSRDMGDPTPLIRLALANAGARQDRWETAVRRLKEMARGEERLVAVVGWAVSTEDTERAAMELSEAGIPMVASVASGDGLRHDRVPGLVRVTPSNTDFVAALAEHLRNEGDGGEAPPRTAMLVYDVNEPDLHVSTLTAAMRRRFAEELAGRPEQPFTGTRVTSDASVALFDPIVRNICQSRVDTVLFSGRTGDLEGFLDALVRRTCADESLSVLFVETGPVVPAEREAELRRAQLTVVHASASDPRWSADRDADPGAEWTPEGFAGFRDALAEVLPEGGDVTAALPDGYALAHHDAVMVAVEAIRVRNAAGPDRLPDPSEVRSELFKLNTANAVRAAGGTLSFTTSRAGDPGDKPIPVIEVPAPEGGDAPARRPYTTPEL
ncbi:hypothetical protein GCM10027160_36830 [Streptomyces calidiresistens]